MQLYVKDLKNVAELLIKYDNQNTVATIDGKVHDTEFSRDFEATRNCTLGDYKKESRDGNEICRDAKLKI